MTDYSKAGLTLQQEAAVHAAFVETGYEAPKNINFRSTLERAKQWEADTQTFEDNTEALLNRLDALQAKYGTK